MEAPGDLPIRGVDHVVIGASDWDATTAFFREVLHAQVIPLEGRRVSYRIGASQLNVHGPGVDLSSNVARLPVRPGNSDLCFEWDGPIEDAIAHLHACDVTVETGPVSRPGARGEGTSVYFRDPDGSLLEFISYHPVAAQDATTADDGDAGEGASGSVAGEQA
ncbi:VOC family protein [Microbacterium sp. CIAB417]|uniref:VOC family protein n=1 Tax=Microbacterium sp. CIAB417 TaxID=2860287 RepID=UPI001FAC76B7|nr:VOC family protein [Microbacterium sp. CIAB417]